MTQVLSTDSFEQALQRRLGERRRGVGGGHQPDARPHAAPQGAQDDEVGRIVPRQNLPGGLRALILWSEKVLAKFGEGSSVVAVGSICCPRLVGRRKAGKFKHVQILLHNAV